MLETRRAEVLGSGGRVLFSEPWGVGIGSALGVEVAWAGIGAGVVVGPVDVDVDVGFDGCEGSRLPHTAPRPCNSPRAANFSKPFSRPKIRPSIRPALAPSATPWSWAVM